ncbi:MAG TPA: hypothetical protein ENI48_00935 [Thioploca sp.]|nr:hypothetical protein [Thioploca sp.]
MNVSQHAQFEYVFYFLFRTYLWQDNRRWDEPPLGLETNKRHVLQHGIRFGEDKRLFRRNVDEGEPLENWAEHLTQKWQQICQVYAEAWGNQKQAQQYCQQALLGVALLILDQGDSVEHHSVNVQVTGEDISTLQFAQPIESEALFRVNIDGFNQTASCHRFRAITSETRPFLKNLQLRLDNNTLPYLAPLQDSESAANAALLVCAFSFGSNVPEWTSSIRNVLIGRNSSTGRVLSKQPPLLSTVFARLIMGQWQFMRIEFAAQNVRFRLQDRNAYYANYAHQGNEARPHCARTRLLEKQLQEMHSLDTQARFVISRIQGALQTIEINGDNLAKRLEQIRQEVQQLNAQLQFHLGEAQKVRWQSSDDEIPILAVFKLSLIKLQDHQVYIAQQLKYLEALRDKWRLYLEKRKTQLGEYLNTLGTVLIFLLAGTTGMVTLNVNKGLLGLTFENPYIYLGLIALVLTPILWRITAWTAKRFCCIFYGTWLSRLFCNPIAKWVESVEFFNWFKKP